MSLKKYCFKERELNLKSLQRVSQIVSRCWCDEEGVLRIKEMSPRVDDRNFQVPDEITNDGAGFAFSKESRT